MRDSAQKWIVIIFVCLSVWGFADARKVKNSFRVDKERKTSKRTTPVIEGMEICIADSIGESFDREIYGKLEKCSFAGYDKEPNSNIESFILINESPYLITGYNLRIDYLDMQGRMLHSRTVKEPCYVPGGETRRFDIKSWDTQHTYYYYLGNEPRKVATPFQVTFTPLSFWVLDQLPSKETKNGQ